MGPPAMLKGWIDRVWNQGWAYGPTKLKHEHGLAIGIGSIATYSCDLIVASERAEWRAPQVQLGVMPAYGGSPPPASWRP